MASALYEQMKREVALYEHAERTAYAIILLRICMLYPSRVTERRVDAFCRRFLKD